MKKTIKNIFVSFFLAILVFTLPGCFDDDFNNWGQERNTLEIIKRDNPEIITYLKDQSPEIDFLDKTERGEENYNPLKQSVDTLFEYSGKYTYVLSDESTAEMNEDEETFSIIAGTANFSTWTITIYYCHTIENENYYLTEEAYIVTLSHEISHLKYNERNESNTEYNALTTLFDSGNDYYHKIACFFILDNFDLDENNEYCCIRKLYSFLLKKNL